MILPEWTIADLNEKMESGELTARQIVELYLQRIEAVDRFFEYVTESDSILAESRKTDMVRLSDEDPTRYLKMKAHLEDQGNKYAAWQQNRDRLIADQVARYQKAELDRLVEAWPEVTDRTKVAGDVAVMNAYLKERGFTQEEAHSIQDHRFVLVIRDAARFRQQQRARPETAKKVAALPKVQKPGVAQPKSAPAQDRKAALTQRLKKTGKTEDAAAVFFDML